MGNPGRHGQRGSNHNGRPKPRTSCDRCGAGGLHWIETGRKAWRLADRETGKVHSCRDGQNLTPRKLTPEQRRQIINDEHAARDRASRRIKFRGEPEPLGAPSSEPQGRPIGSQHRDSHKLG